MRGWLMAFAVAVTAGPAPNAGAQDFRVREAFWTTSRDPNKRLLNPGTRPRVSPGARVYFWTRIVGDGETLDVLDEEEELPFRHQWFRVGATVLADEAPVPRPYNFSPSTMKRLEESVRAGGEFEWLFFSQATRGDAGGYTVKVVTFSDAPLCPGGAGCKFSIRFK